MNILLLLVTLSVYTFSCGSQADLLEEMPRELKSVKCTKVDRSTRNVVFVLVATFRAEGGQIENCYIGKTLSDLADFRKTVIQLSATQDNSRASHQLLPDVKEKKPLFAAKRDEKNKSTVDDFCQHVVKLPSPLLNNETVVDFFYNSSAPDEERAIKLLKDTDSAAVKTTAKGKADAASVSSSSSSAPVAAASGSKSCEFTGSEATYEEVSHNTGDSSHPPLSSEYAEVKTSAETPNSRSVFTDVSDYAGCVAPGANSVQSHFSEAVKLRELPGRPVAEEALYASVFKPKPPEATNPQPQPTGDALYEDTASFAPPVKHEEEPALYDDAACSAAFYNHQQQHQQQSKPPTAPRPRGPGNTSEHEVKQPSSPKKPASSAPSSGPAPLTPIPPMPQFQSPTLLSPEVGQSNGTSAGVSDSGGIQVVAIEDYKSNADNILSFKRGTLATLLLQSDSNWWCIRLGTAHGWVPAAYWRMLNSGDCASLITKGNSPWFVGKLSRAECEALLMEHGKQQHFVVRESDSGHYALSVKHDDRIHHFPIEVTADKKYNIGKHDFKTVNNVILYYQKNALFRDEQGHDVTLGSPLVIIKH